MNVQSAGSRYARVHDGLALAVATAINLACGSGTAAAQATTLAEDDAISLPTVEVVGSHIRRVEYETVQPVLVLDRGDLERTGLTSVGDILQQLPQHMSAGNTDVNNGGNGETRVDLRNLGEGRTLVLLNGHRYVTTLDGAVDVGSIPLPIVERIEVLTEGASAIYGSDAIAGVINIITRDDYDGIEASAYYGSSEHGDGERTAVDFTWGHKGERGSLALNLSVATQKPIWAGDREISAVPRFGLPPNSVDAFASHLTPDGIFAFGEFQLPDGEPGALTYDPTLGDHRPFDFGRDGYNYAPENYLRTPYERAALFAVAHYEVTPTVSLRSEVLLHERRSRQALAPLPIEQVGFIGEPYQHEIATDNLYNTFGQPVTYFGFRPFNRPRWFEQDVSTSYLAVGLEGLLQIGTRSFDWGLDVIDARTHEALDVGIGYDLNRLGLGVGPSFVDRAGTPRCGTPAAPVAGCVPLDFLHGAAGFTDAMFDYIAVSGGIEETRRLRDFSLNLSGTVFDLPAGALAMAAGLEHRRERISLDPDALLGDPAFYFGGDPDISIGGESRISEAYLEFEIPLLAKRRWVHAFELSVASRYSRYSSFGSTTNSKLGLSWRPTPDWLVRANWSQGYRAPPLVDLYGVSLSDFTFGDFARDIDPCADDPVGVVAERCAAAGVPLDTFDPQVGPRLLTGANPDLQPEQARNRALGVVWSPARIKGLDLSLDWWRIELTDAIDAGFGAESLLIDCYENGIANACQLVTRDPSTGLLLEIDARLQNQGFYEVEGYDFGLGYRWSNAWGAFEFRSDTVYMTRWLIESPKGAPVFSGVGNYTGEPFWRLRSLMSLDWERGVLGATVTLRYYSDLDESCLIPLEAGDPSLCDRPDLESPTFNGEPEHDIDARTYTDLQLRWQLREGTVVSLGVNNAFDVDPPVAYSAYANSYDPSYDVPGRFWYVNIQHRFR